jgi:hypothetical protein
MRRLAKQLALHFIGEEFRMLAPPFGPALPVLSENNAEPHARAPITILALFAQPEHPLPQFVANTTRIS